MLVITISIVISIRTIIKHIIMIMIMIALIINRLARRRQWRMTPCMLCCFSHVNIHQRGMQWKQGVVVYIILYAVLL